ncbi:MAG: hypothetical protein ABIE55_03750 [Candidatus Aenigmatarchaeota archaeon]
MENDNLKMVLIDASDGQWVTVPKPIYETVIEDKGFLEGRLYLLRKEHPSL